VRKLMLLICVGLAGAGAALLPSLGSAQGTTATFNAVDSQPFFGQHFFYVAGTTDSTAQIAVGGTVTFSYLTGTSSHNVVFTGPQPTSCTQTATAPGYRIGPTPPLPAVAEPPGWSGTCTFDTAGTYPFDSAADGPAMSGTVIVGSTPTSTQTTATVTTPPPIGGGGTSTNNGYTHFPAAGGTLRAVASQHGSVVRGQVHVTTPNSKVVADLDYGHPALRIGRTSLKGVGAGTRHITIGLYKRGARLLAAHRRLSLTLKVEIVGQGVGPTFLTRRVTLIK
jgi:plastocyanin